MLGVSCAAENILTATDQARRVITYANKPFPSSLHSHTHNNWCMEGSIRLTTVGLTSLAAIITDSLCKSLFGLDILIFKTRMTQ